MIRWLIILLLIVGCGTQQKDITYQFTSLKNSINKLINHDEFTNRWSKFDIDVRLNKQNGNKNELFQYISTQVLQWSESEKIKVDSLMQSINNDIKHLKLKIDYPDTIFFIKTTGEEEGNATGYTRSSCLILNDETL